MRRMGFTEDGYPVELPYEILYDPTLNPTDKLFIGVLRMCDLHDKGCPDTNAELGSLLGVTERTVSRMVTKFTSIGYLWAEPFDGRARVLHVSSAVLGVSPHPHDPNPEDYSEHPRANRDFARRERLALLERHGNRCEACGKTDHPFALHLHHKEGAVEGGRNRHGARKEQKEHPERFVLLCTSCHGKAHRGDPVYKGRVKANA